MTKRAEINLTSSIDSRKKSLPSSLIRGKYDAGAKIVRKSRPSTTKNGDGLNKDISNTFDSKKDNKSIDPKKEVMLGTSFTGRKDFAEKPA